jgi:hypothetical protein
VQAKFVADHNFLFDHWRIPDWRHSSKLPEAFGRTSPFAWKGIEGDGLFA